MKFSWMLKYEEGDDCHSMEAAACASQQTYCQMPHIACQADFRARQLRRTGIDAAQESGGAGVRKRLECA
jgi:hypothetical protein